ncbi:ABC transporter substrate-binding protein [Devosia nitrariae]|uniref:Peptide ABC transporter substrate-binding protein n=1 Tax=Devosia nitrariae TaxID=2071872 RepID=A0ABQ5W5P1_9HYPH|nr:ABC transporter substrate-binding protein [Devosia nitrariae]GLQ55174.1 peptide ABC transporter substrate-binding protein [Devosia nitrariae]
MTTSKYLRKQAIIGLGGVVLTALMVFPGAALAFNQAPALDSEVEAGTLPPVDDRLPAQPMVLEPLDEVGVYGGSLRTDILGGTDRGYGWINRIIGYEPLVRWAPEGGRVIPNIAESWEANDDSTEFIFKLREGLRWSDGAPVTAHDVTFFVEDMAKNTELFPGGPGGHLEVNGQPVVVEALDDLTIKFTFADPYGLFIQQLANANNQPAIAPRHYGEQFHPAYAEDLDAKVAASGFTSWVELFQQKVGGPTGNNFASWVNPELPSLHAWTVTQPYDGSSSQVVAKRNPYYWKVDTAENQLPYLDEVVFPIIGDTEVLKLMVMNGQIDFTYRPQNLTLADKAVFFDSMEAGQYHFIELSPDVSATQAIHLNLTTTDPNRNALFNEKDFRIALSHAIDRQEIIDIIYVGQGEPYQVAPRPESQFYDEVFAHQYTEFDPDLANQMLDDLGLTDRNSAGIRLFEDSSPISIQVDVRTDTTPQIDGLELIQRYWADVGIELRINVIDSALYRERQVGNLFEAISNVGAGGLNEMLNPRLYVPINDNALYAVPWSYWYNEDPRGIEPDETTMRQLELYDDFLATADEARQVELFAEILGIARDEFRTLGISLITGTYAIAGDKMGNIPTKMIDSAIYPTPAPTNPSTWYVKAQ